MSFKDLSIFSSDSHFVQWSGTICAILVEGIMGHIHVKLFKLGPGVTLANIKNPLNSCRMWVCTVFLLKVPVNRISVMSEGERKEWDRLRGPNPNPNLPQATCQQAK